MPRRRIINDPRYKAVRALGERKQLFNEYTQVGPVADDHLLSCVRLLLHGIHTLLNERLVAPRPLASRPDRTASHPS
jgi:hypothetical protein